MFSIVLLLSFKSFPLNLHHGNTYQEWRHLITKDILSQKTVLQIYGKYSVYDLFGYTVLLIFVCVIFQTHTVRFILQATFYFQKHAFGVSAAIQSVPLHYISQHKWYHVDPIVF